jgi:hypothetical protein
MHSVFHSDIKADWNNFFTGIGMKFWKHNGLSITFLILFLISIAGQVFTGLKEYNSEREEQGVSEIGLREYFGSGHFLQSTFENWESEFLQMGLFVVLTIFLYQKGSSESKDPDGKEEVDRKPNPRRKNAPAAVKKGGVTLAVYKHSLSIALFLFFLLSFLLHWYGSLKYYNEEQAQKGEATVSGIDFLSHSRFWFESFQNWQSEFLSVFAIVIFSVFLRQKGSPQSKPVDAPHSETGE